MRRVVVVAFVALLVHACTISSAQIKPGEALARHQECDRSARKHTRSFRDEWMIQGAGAGGGDGGGAGAGALLAFPPIFLLAAAVTIVVLPPLAIAHGVKTTKARQNQYDFWYDDCMKPRPLEPPSLPEAPPESPQEEPPSRVLSG